MNKNESKYTHNPCHSSLNVLLLFFKCVVVVVVAVAVAVVVVVVV